VDPDSLNPVPDPGFGEQKLKKKVPTAEIFFLLFFIKNCNLLIPRPP
jgi:hypothetical protein